MASCLLSPIYFFYSEEDTQEIQELISFLDFLLLDIEGFSKGDTFLQKRKFESFLQSSDQE